MIRLFWDSSFWCLIVWVIVVSFKQYNKDLCKIRLISKGDKQTTTNLGYNIFDY